MAGVAPGRTAPGSWGAGKPPPQGAQRELQSAFGEAVGPPPGLGLNSVGSSHNSQSPGGLHPKLCRKTPHNLGVLGTTSGIKKTSKNAENNSILVSGDFPRLGHGHSQVSVMPSLQYSCIKDMKNEANEAIEANEGDRGAGGERGDLGERGDRCERRKRGG